MAFRSAESREMYRRWLSETEIEGQRFRGWLSTEKDGMQMVSINLPTWLDQYEPNFMLKELLQSIKIKCEIIISQTIRHNHGRIVHFLVPEESAKKIEERGGCIGSPCGNLSCVLRPNREERVERPEEMACALEAMGLDSRTVMVDITENESEEAMDIPQIIVEKGSLSPRPALSSNDGLLEEVESIIRDDPVPEVEKMLEEYYPHLKC